MYVEAGTPPRKQLVNIRKQMENPSFRKTKLSLLGLQFLLAMYSAARPAYMYVYIYIYIYKENIHILAGPH